MARTSETLRRVIAAPAPLVWALVADSNRFDRAAGLAPGRYRFVERDGRRERVAAATQYGFDIEWVEPPYQWIEGRSIRGAREFLKGPARAGGFAVTLTPDEDAPAERTIVDAEVWVQPKGPLGPFTSLFVRPQLRASLRRYLAAVDGLLERARTRLGGFGERLGLEPAANLAQRLLLSVEAESTTSGGITKVRDSELVARAGRFAAAPVAPPLRARIVELLRARPDEEVTAMRPFELARAWERPRREVLAAFLHAARAGLVELVWQINCPTCRVGASSAKRLEEVGRTAHCDSCAIEYDVDFGEHVEAVFAISQAIRKISPMVWCASSPSFRPHVFAQLSTGATTPRCDLPSGSFLVRSLRGPRATIEIDDAPEVLAITVEGDRLEVSKRGRAGRGGTAIEVTCDDPHDLVLIERTGWSADVVLGSVVASFPEFHDLFATEAPAAGVDLSVSGLSILFSDLTGSTALYERIGDARAFAVVEAHFRAMESAIAAHDGAIVKTMGDAVMASFSSPADALSAALAMVEACARDHRELGLHVKIGVHEGPCLAVRANERLDFFGTTVNVAARLQAQARADEIVIAESLLGHPEITEIVREREGRIRRFDAALKGIREIQRLIGIDAGSSEGAASVGERASG
jgi:class 3 adenylate cyclase